MNPLIQSFGNLMSYRRIRPQIEFKSLKPLNGEQLNHMMEIDAKPDDQIDAKPLDSSTVSQTKQSFAEENEKEMETEVKKVLNNSFDIIDKCLPKRSNYVKIKNKSSLGSKSRSKPSINYLNLLLGKLFSKSSSKRKSKSDSLRNGPKNSPKNYRIYTKNEIKEIKKRKVNVLAKKFDKMVINGEVRYLLPKEVRMRVPYTYFPLRVKKRFLEPQEGRDDSQREEVHKPIAHMSVGPKRITNQEINWRAIGMTEPNIKALNYWSYDTESEPIVSPKRVSRV